MIELVLPCFSERTILPECKSSVVRLLDDPAFNIVYEPEKHNNIDPARTLNKAIKTRNKLTTHMLFVDSDIAFEPNDVLRLYNTKCKVISGAYTKHNRIVAGLWGDCPGNNKYWMHPKETGLKKIDWCGTGFLLVHVSVFDALEPPYFYYPVLKQFGDYASYDIGFCMQLTRANIPLYLNATVKVEHLQRC